MDAAEIRAAIDGTAAAAHRVGLSKCRLLVLRYSSACGRGFVCFVVGPCTLTESKTKHTKHLPQADE